MNTLEDFEDLACNPNMNVKFDDTLYEVANFELERSHNCTIPFLPIIISNETGKPTDICKNPSIGYKALKLYDYIRISGLSTVSSIPCAVMNIAFGLPNIDKKGQTDRSYLRLYLKTTTKVKYTVVDYDFLTLLAELGGYSGLVIGRISLAQIIIMINSFLFKRMNIKFTKHDSIYSE